jgi:hypothetical protein
MVRTEISTIDVLRNNAKTIGGVLGAEQAFIDRVTGEMKRLPKAVELFYDRKTLDLQDISFVDIERTRLGR